jgi:hypothetical protein
MTYSLEPSGKLKLLTPEELAAADIDSTIIVLNTGVLEDGTPYWAYVAVKPSRYSEFMRLTASRQPISLKEYGEILKCGLDKTVPEAARQEMARDYGCDDNYLSLLAEDVRKAQLAYLTDQVSHNIGDIVAKLKKK